MRSDRNPYFLLRKSKDPKIQSLLSQATTMSVEQIQQLKIKPDVQKAMLFVRTFGAVDKSQTVANLIADKATVCNNTLPKYEIWHYLGATVEVSLSRNNSLLMNDFLFLRDQSRIFVSHNWTDLHKGNNLAILSHSSRVGFGDQLQYNRAIQDHLNHKHSGCS